MCVFVCVGRRHFSVAVAITSRRWWKIISVREKPYSLSPKFLSSPYTMYLTSYSPKSFITSTVTTHRYTHAQI